MVFLISSGGIKWSSLYRSEGNGGRKWGELVYRWGTKSGSGDYPHADESPDILTNPNFYP